MSLSTHGMGQDKNAALPEVICLGILIADIFPSPLPSLPAPGELSLVEKYIMSAGGCAANTAACLRRLGRRVGVVGKIGLDILGDFVLRDLHRHGIETSAVCRSATHPTSNTYIINVRGDDRRYIHCIGANADFRAADVPLSAFQGARALYVGGYLLMPGFGQADLTRLFRDAKSLGLITVLDVVVNSGSGVSLEHVQEVLPFTDLFLPNDDEGRVLTGKTDPLDQAEIFSAVNPNCRVVITMGRRGALARHQGRTFRAGTFQVQSVDESGAGDAFTAGFITAMLEQWPLEQALRFASVVGASCTRALGCSEGVFNYHEALELVTRDPIMVELIS
jgi:sugar/nucleoside kinase (ribokinase family)